MLNVVVNGFWGPRGESVPDIAERWSGTLTALKDIDGPTFDVWHEAGDDLPSDPVLKPSAPALAEYIERKNTGPDLDVVGRTMSLWAQNPGAARVSLAIHAGSTSHYAVNSVSLAFRSREVDETAAVIRRAPEILRLLAESWGIDAGQVYDRPQYRAVAERFGLENSDPAAAVRSSSPRAGPPSLPRGCPERTSAPRTAGWSSTSPATVRSPRPSKRSSRRTHGCGRPGRWRSSGAVRPGHVLRPAYLPGLAHRPVPDPQTQPRIAANPSSSPTANAPSTSVNTTGITTGPHAPGPATVALRAGSAGS